MKHAIRSAALVGLLAQVAAAQTADFDRLPEAFMGRAFVDNGIQFSNLVDFFGGNGDFVVDRADGNLSGMPGFTPRMAMGFSEYAPGPEGGIYAVRSFQITRGSPANQASIELFIAGAFGNTITLQAIAGTTVVASQSVLITPGSPGIRHYGLSVAGPWFDRLRVVGRGNNFAGAFSGMVDHVVIGTGGAAAGFGFGDEAQSPTPMSEWPPADRCTEAAARRTAGLLGGHTRITRLLGPAFGQPVRMPLPPHSGANR